MPTKNCGMEKHIEFGLEIIAAIKSNVYQCSIEDAMVYYVRDVLDLTGFYAKLDPNNPGDKRVIEHEQKQLMDQADFIGRHAVNAAKRIGI